MAADRWRGLKRLVLAVGVPWFGWWGITGVVAYRRIPEYLKLSAAAGDRGDWTTAASRMEVVNEASAALNASLRWGVVVPIALIVICGLAYWVYRGFKPRA